MAGPVSVCRPARDRCDVAERCSGTSATCPAEIVRQGECGDGCADAGEQCGESALPPCGAGETCAACRCVACAGADLGCGGARDADAAADVVIVSGSDALGEYGFALAWDPTLLAAAEIAGGATLAFVDPPRCEIDAAAGFAVCRGSQAPGSDGASRRVHVARVRFRRLAPVASRPTIRLVLEAAAAPGGGLLPICTPEATCRLAECRLGAECEDDDPCTDDTCTDGGCRHEPIAGYAGADCELRKIAAMPCGPGVVPGRLEQRVRKAITRARRLLERAGRGPAARGGRLVRKAEVLLARLGGRIERSTKLDAGCRATIAEMVAERAKHLAVLRRQRVVADRP
jgi:hypothetical protein